MKSNEEQEYCCNRERRDKLFCMKFKIILNKENIHTNIASQDSLLDWHQRMAHQNSPAQEKKIFKKSNHNFRDQSFFYKDCIVGKMHRLLFPKSQFKSERAGELVHADLCGPMQVTSLRGSHYFLLLKDDYIHWREVYFIKHKSEVIYCFKNFFKKTKKHLKEEIKILRTDKGLEFINKEIEDLTQRYGLNIKRQYRILPRKMGSSNEKIESC